MSLTVMGAAGLVGGAFKYLLERYMTLSHQRQMYQLKQAKAVRLDRYRAAKVKDEGVSMTRRILAVMAMLTICLPVVMTIFYPDATITVPEAYVKKGFWDYILPWKEGKEMVRYITVKAPILAMPIVDLMALMVGYYFGDKGTRRIL